MSDSSAGMSAAIDGICDIGMASRELKDSELEAGLTPIVMAMDGIAVIVNNENPATGMALDALKAIYLGETLTWDAA
jgi:phosphate transport system substrate-binding protein